MRCCGLIIVLLWSAATLAEEKKPTIAERLYLAQWSGAEQELRRRIADNPRDADARLQLGFVQTFRTFERFAAFQWEYGARFDRAALLMPRGVFPGENPAPNRLSYRAWRRNLETVLHDLEAAERTLADVPEAATFRVSLRKLQWDPDGDGKPQPLMPREIPESVTRENPDLEVAVDATDAVWLRGYCHFLLGTLNVILAVDGQALFDDFAVQAYKNPIIAEADAGKFAQTGFIEPDRLSAARRHWLRTAELSDAMWKSAERETDNDREWIPNPRQTSAVLPWKVTAEMIEAWSAGMNESKALLEGRKLNPRWRLFGRRPEPQPGVNLKRLLDDPPPGPIIAWLFEAPEKYLEDGELIDEGVYHRLQPIFGDNLVWFGLWVN